MSSNPPPDFSPSPGPTSAKWWVMLGVGLGVLMFTLDTSIVNIALPTLVEVFQITFVGQTPTGDCLGVRSLLEFEYNP